MTVAAVPRWEPETVAWEKQEGSSGDKKLRSLTILEAKGRAELQECFRSTKQVLGSFATSHSGSCA
jgi:hypothetical protein